MRKCLGSLPTPIKHEHAPQYNLYKNWASANCAGGKIGLKQIYKIKFV